MGHPVQDGTFKEQFAELVRKVVLLQITNGKQTRASLGLFLTLLGQPPRLGERGLQESRGWRGQIGVS